MYLGNLRRKLNLPRVAALVHFAESYLRPPQLRGTTEGPIPIAGGLDRDRYSVAQP